MVVEWFNDVGYGVWKRVMKFVKDIYFCNSNWMLRSMIVNGLLYWI